MQIVQSLYHMHLKYHKYQAACDGSKTGKYAYFLDTQWVRLLDQGQSRI